MRAVSFLQCNTVPACQYVQYECSDRLLVAKNIRDSHMFEGLHSLLRITSGIDTFVAGVVYGFHDDVDIIYMPMWMIHTLHATTNLSITSIPKNICTKVSIKPYNSGLFDIDNWHIKLRNGLRFYSTLSRNHTIVMDIDGMIEFSVVGLLPQHYDTVYLIGSGEIEIDIRPSFEIERIVMKEQVMNTTINKAMDAATNTVDYSKIPYLVMIPARLREQMRYDHIKKFTGTPYSIGTATCSLPPIRAAYEAALRRNNIKESVCIENV